MKRTTKIQDLLKKAVAHHRIGEWREAERLYHRVLQTDPTHPDVLHLLGLVKQLKGETAQAEELIRRAIEQDGKAPLFYLSLGNVLSHQKRREEAIESFSRSLSLEPHFPEAHYNLANELYQTNRLEEAIFHYFQALRINPSFAEGHYNLGRAFERQEKLAEAEGCYRTALKLNPDFFDALYNLAIVLSDQGRMEEAASCYRQALAMKPGDVDTTWNLSLILLSMGQLDEGWKKYEWRLQQPKYQYLRSKGTPWEGELLPAQTLLLRAEQGLGDVIQFARFFPLVKQRVGTVFFECQPALVRLLRTLRGIDQLFERQEDLSPPEVAYDVHASLLSLPGIFEVTLDSIPADIPYIFPDPQLVEKWRRRLPSSIGSLRVGIVWAGHVGHRGNTKRSTSLLSWAPLAGIGRVTFFSLQIGEAAAEVQNPPAGMNLIDLTDSIADFADTAAFLSHLDLIISVDTAVAHLAGSMGKPVWTLLPFAPDWRWLFGREDTPWYPTMRLFRQRSPGDWKEIFAEVASDLSGMRDSGILPGNPAIPQGRSP